MATRALIGYEKGEEVRFTYCHYDGYLEGLGVKLVRLYNTREDAKKLANLGDIRAIGDVPNDVEVLDGGEIIEQSVGSIQEYAKQYDRYGVDYIYLFKDEWYYVSVHEYSQTFSKVKDTEEVKERLRELGVSEDEPKVDITRGIMKATIALKRGISEYISGGKTDERGKQSKTFIKEHIDRVISAIEYRDVTVVSTDYKNRPIKAGNKPASNVVIIADDKGNYLKLIGGRNVYRDYYTIEVYFNGTQTSARIDEGKFQYQSKKLGRKPNNINEVLRLKHIYETKISKKID